MSHAIVSFTKITDTSILASTRIAIFLRDTLKLPLYDDERIGGVEKLDLLIIVNGAFAFCKHRDAIGAAVRKARRVVWVQNDYTIFCPINDGIAQTPFRRAFVQRKMRGRADVDRWTTVRKNAILTPGSAYINWNALTAPRTPLKIRQENWYRRAVYYGAYRADRAIAFSRYFEAPLTPVTVSSASGKFQEQYPRLDCVGPARVSLLRWLNRFGFGLYLDDRKSQREFHSPANRFYEMLAAGLPILFDAASIPMLRKAHLDGSLHAIPETPRMWRRLYESRNEIAALQRAQWWTTFRNDLEDRTQQVYTRYCRRFL